MTKLTSFINRYINIDPKELEIILSSFERRLIPKDKFVIKRGQMVTDYYFIDSGGLIMYAIYDEVQHTRYFAFENEFIADISRIKKQGRSVVFIKAIEDTVLYTISYQKMEELYDRFPLWQKFGRLIWEEAFSSVLEGVQSFQSQTAKERYLDLLKRSDVVSRVPLKDLSHFLGITPSSLSRIRKEITI